MSTGQKSEKKLEGTWKMTVGEREEALKSLEDGMEEHGGNLHSLLDKFRARGSRMATDAGKVLAALDKGGLAVDYIEPSHFQDARTVMEGAFVSPYDIMKLDHTPYTFGALSKFYDTLPDMVVLAGILQKGYGLVAGPPDMLTPGEIRDVRKIRSHLHELGKMVTGEDEKVGPRWYAIKLEPVAESRAQPLEDCIQHHLKEDERLPNAAELAWFAAMMLQVNKRPLYAGADVYTSTIYSAAYCGNHRHPDAGHPLTVCVAEKETRRWDDHEHQTIAINLGMKKLRQAHDALYEDSINARWRETYARQCLVPVLEF